MTIQRYESQEPFYDPFESAEGDWVKFEDVVALIRQADQEVTMVAVDSPTDWARGYLYACALLLQRLQNPRVITRVMDDGVKTKDGAA